MHAWNLNLLSTGPHGPRILPRFILARTAPPDPARKARTGIQPAGSILLALALVCAFSRGTTPAQAASSAAKAKLWSVQPLVKPQVPHPTGGMPTLRNPIDAFIAAELAKRGLTGAPEADPATLVRRLTFDLTGLPPTPAELESFITDTSSNAYERLVDRLLASSRYGERWARHWLDIVHYGETHGYDKDKPRPNAWPYRDYVIRAFNADKPYQRFVQEQVAGDVLFPHTRDGVEALGFISAGPWDFIGHAEVPETKIDGRVARHLDRDDMVVNTIQTFNSLTVQCAQCHDHKFDPISSEDYYSLQAVFAAVDRTDRKYDEDEAIARRRAEIDAERTVLESRRKDIDDRIVARAGEPLKELDRKIAEALAAAKKGDAFGYHSAISLKQDVEKWVQVDLGRMTVLTNILLHPSKDDFNGIGEGFGFPIRFRIEASTDPEFRQDTTLIASRTADDVVNPKVKPQSFPVSHLTTRYLRVTATKLAPRQNDFIFALAELAAIAPGGTNVALGRTVTALDSVEAPVRWQKANLTDGWYPGAGSVESPALARLREERTAAIAAATLASENAELDTLKSALASVADRAGKLPAPRVVYAGSVHTGRGAFMGTGGNGGKPRVIRVLSRGNVEKGGREATAGALSCLSELPSRFNLPPDHKEGDRRAALARWLTSRDNPLTWRSIVNRVWQYHFGRGLVETPSDFGRMGGVPSHPELLDWLACEFRDGGQSLKQLHKLIVMSAAYRQQSSAASPTAAEAGAAVDADNRLLWKQNRRKLEAEAVRDSVLYVAGKLDFRMGGPSFQDFVIDKPDHSPHYEYHLHDPDDPASHRRSIYRFIVRSQQQPFMTTLDCADPSMQVSRRNESVSPLQALAMMNNALIVAMSKHFAARLEATGLDMPGKVRRACLEALGHPPSDEDAARMAAYAREFGLPNFCRLVFNLNEFSFID